MQVQLNTRCGCTKYLITPGLYPDRYIDVPMLWTNKSILECYKPDGAITKIRRFEFMRNEQLFGQEFAVYVEAAEK